MCKTSKKYYKVLAIIIWKKIMFEISMLFNES